MKSYEKLYFDNNDEQKLYFSTGSQLSLGCQHVVCCFFSFIYTFSHEYEFF